MARFKTLGKRPTEVADGFIGRVRFDTLMLLDERTTDGRLFVADGAGSRDLPLPVMVLAKRSMGGHLDAEMAGRLDFLEILSDPPRIAAEGQLLDTPEGRKMALLVTTGAMRGNSADLEILEAKSRLIEDEDGFRIEMDALEFNLAGTTGVPFPAFPESTVEMMDDIDLSELGFANVTDNDSALSYISEWADTLSRGVDDFDAKVASLSFHASDKSGPPAEWFSSPHLDCPTPPTADGGRVFGHVAEWGVCHTSYPGQCVTAPRSPSEYAHAQMDMVETDLGKLQVGRLYTGSDHPGLKSTWEQTIHAYDQHCTQWARCRFGEDDHGIWFSGELMADLDDRPLSGDWRQRNGHLELATALSVDVAGFPMTESLALGDVNHALVGAGVIWERGKLLVASGGMYDPSILAATTSGECGCGCGERPGLEEIHEDEAELPEDVLAWIRHKMSADKASDIRALLEGVALDLPARGSTAANRVRELLVKAGIELD